MFNCIYCVIWLYDRLEWFEVCLELVMCEFLNMDVELCGVLLSWKYEILDFTKNLVQWNRDTWFVNRWIIVKFCLYIPKICFYSLTIWILKIINFGLPLSENGALSAIPIEGNCAEQPTVALSPISTEGNCAECPKVVLSPIPTKGNCTERPKDALSEP